MSDGPVTCFSCLRYPRKAVVWMVLPRPCTQGPHSSVKTIRWKTSRRAIAFLRKNDTHHLIPQNRPGALIVLVDEPAEAVHLVVAQLSTHDVIGLNVHGLDLLLRRKLRRGDASVRQALNNIASGDS